MYEGWAVKGAADSLLHRHVYLRTMRLLAVIGAGTASGVLVASGEGAIVLLVSLMGMAFVVHDGVASMLMLVALAGAVGIPSGYGLANLVPVEVLVLGQGIPVQSILAVLVGWFGLIVALRLPDRPTLPAFLRVPALLGGLIALVALVLAVLGSHGTVLSRVADAHILALYVLLPILIALAARAPAVGSILLRAMVYGILIYAIAVMGLYLWPAGRQLVYGDAFWSMGTRTGFAGSGIASLLIVPLLGASEDSRSGAQVPRYWIWLALAASMAVVLVSQSRAYISSALIAACLYWPIAHARSRRGVDRRDGQVSQRVTLLVTVVLVALALWQTGQVFEAIVGRGLPSIGQSSVMSRVQTFARTSRDLSGHLWLGKGFGAPLTVYSPSGVAIGEARFVDNAFLTAMSKGGLLLAGLLAALLGSVAWASIRVARMGRGGPQGRMMLGWGCAVPPYLAAASLPSAHVVNAPSIPVALALVTGVLCASAIWRGDES